MVIKDGILVINKPQNWTSHDCVAVCRKVLGVKKVGHGGTLDPMAEGVLPVFIGKATRIMEYTDMDYKTYSCRVKLGIVTDTQDIWGEISERRSTEGISEDDIRKALLQFRGNIEQIPPKYSALKVNGMKLYEYARKGIEVEIKPRTVHVKALTVKNVDLPEMEAAFDVTCSKGTYIRSICSDLGERLGCGAAMSYLKRTESGIFSLEESLTPEEIKGMDISDIERYLIPIDRPLAENFGKAEIKRDRALYFANGSGIRWNQVKADEKSIEKSRACGGKLRVYQEESGKFLGVGYYDRKNNELKADKIFVTRQEI